MRVPDRKLILDNGQEFCGFSFGSKCRKVCDIIFNTSVVGYQEIASDPSYTEQIVVMTYPLIGNYGITDEDFEAKFMSIGGMVVREYCETPSNFRYTKTISETLEEFDIPGIAGVDTRMISRIIRDGKCKRAAIVDIDTTVEEALELIAKTPENDFPVKKVSCKKRWFARTPQHKYDVVAVDCGIKYNIVRILNKLGCNVIIVPYNTPYERIKAFSPDGLFISNGPGSPYEVPEVVDLIKQFKGTLPIFGVGLGHELIGLAYGAKAVKQKSGIHGDRPAKDMKTNKIEVAVLNQSFQMDAESVKESGLEITHISIPEQIVLGYEKADDMIFSTQFHPEAAPGPQDCTHLFDKFIKMMEDNRNA